jgi:hypothetical protein
LKRGEFYKLAFREIIKPKYKGRTYQVDNYFCRDTFKVTIKSAILREYKELEIDQVSKLYERVQKKLEPIFFVAISLYELMKREHKESKSTFSYSQELILNEFEITKKYGKHDSRILKESAMDYLLQNKIIFFVNDFYMTKDEFTDDMVIAASIQKLLANKKFKKHEKKLKSKKLTLMDFADMLKSTDSSIRICEEQQSVIEKFNSGFVIGISGAAGSGKSELVRTLIRILLYKRIWKNQIATNVNNKNKKEKIIVTSFQSVNVSEFTGSDDIIAMTLHQLLFIHETQCIESPNCSAQNSGVCIFNSVTTIFVEECGLVTPALLSRLLASVINCGKLKRILFCGDKNQIKSISAGNLLDDLRTSLYTKGFWFDFIHDHRTNHDARLLGKIAVNIANGKEFQFDDEVCKEIVVPAWKYNSKIEELAPIVDIIYNYLKENKIQEYGHLITTRLNIIKEYISDELSFQFAKDRDSNTIRRSNGVYVGGKVLPKQNDYEHGIRTNDISILYAIRDTSVHIEPQQRIKSYVNVPFIDSPKMIVSDSFYREYVLIPIKDMEKFTKGLIDKFMSMKINYASYNCENKPIIPKIISGAVVTVNAVQGRECDNIIYLANTDTLYDTREILYTAVTRAKSNILILHTGFNLKKMIERKEAPRNTNLSYLIDDYIEKIGFGNVIEYKNFNLGERKHQELYNKSTEKKASFINSLIMSQKFSMLTKEFSPVSESTKRKYSSMEINEEGEFFVKKIAKSDFKTNNKQYVTRHWFEVYSDITKIMMQNFMKLESFKNVLNLRITCKFFKSILGSEVCSRMLELNMIKRLELYKISKDCKECVIEINPSGLVERRLSLFFHGPDDLNHKYTFMSPYNEIKVLDSQLISENKLNKKVQDQRVFICNTCKIIVSYQNIEDKLMSVDLFAELGKPQVNVTYEGLITLCNVVTKTPENKSALEKSGKAFAICKHGKQHYKCMNTFKVFFKYISKKYIKIQSIDSDAEFIDLKNFTSGFQNIKLS